VRYGEFAAPKSVAIASILTLNFDGLRLLHARKLPSWQPSLVPGYLDAASRKQSRTGGVMTQFNKLDTIIGRRIRLRKIQLGIETKSLAASVKITEARLKAFEVGRDSIGAELLAEIAGALGVSSAYFFSAPRTGFAPSRLTQIDVRDGVR
jgi:hypothetical protein